MPVAGFENGSGWFSTCVEEVLTVLAAAWAAYSRTGTAIRPVVRLHLLALTKSKDDEPDQRSTTDHSKPLLQGHCPPLGRLSWRPRHLQSLAVIPKPANNQFWGCRFRFASGPLWTTIDYVP
jgi:hypothetical protein